MKKINKLTYVIAFIAFISKIGLELSRGGDFTWALIGMMWYLVSLVNEIELIKIKSQIEELIDKLKKNEKI